MTDQNPHQDITNFATALRAAMAEQTPDLQGSERQREWASSIRAATLSDLEESLEMFERRLIGGDYDERMACHREALAMIAETLPEAIRCDSAAAWIDARDGKRVSLVDLIRECRGAAPRPQNPAERHAMELAKTWLNDLSTAASWARARSK